MTKENPFAKAQKQRELEQAQIKKNLGIKTDERSVNRKVRLDVTIPSDTKQKLLDYADTKGLSASVVIQMLIDENC